MEKFTLRERTTFEGSGDLSGPRHESTLPVIRSLCEGSICQRVQLPRTSQGGLVFVLQHDSSMKPLHV